MLLQPCYLDRVLFKVRLVPHQFLALRWWTNEEIKSREKAKFEVEFGKGALQEPLDETKLINQEQEIHEKKPL